MRRLKHDMSGNLNTSKKASWARPRVNSKKDYDMGFAMSTGARHRNRPTQVASDVDAVDNGNLSSGGALGFDANADIAAVNALNRAFSTRSSVQNNNFMNGQIQVKSGAYAPESGYTRLAKRTRDVESAKNTAFSVRSSD